MLARGVRGAAAARARAARGLRARGVAGDAKRRLVVRGADAQLCSLEEDYAFASSATVAVGDALYRADGDAPVGVVAFAASGLFFGAALQGGLSAGQELFTRRERRLALPPPLPRDAQQPEPARAAGLAQACFTEPDAPAVFRAQPRDTEREVITEGWASGLSAVDALTPLGRGQSMLWTCAPTRAMVTRRDRLMLDAALGILRDAEGPHAWVAVPPRGNRLSEVFDAEVLDARLRQLGLRGRVTLVAPPDAEEAQDSDIVGLLNSFWACALAERRRDSGGHALLLLPDLHSHYRVWRRAQRLAVAHVKERRGVVPASTFAPGADRADLRQFYSALIQRSARLNAAAGGGTLSTLQGVLIGTAPKEGKVLGGAFGGFSSSRAGGTGGAAPRDEPQLTLRELMAVARTREEADRLLALAKRGIRLTASNMAKLGVAVPLTAEHERPPAPPQPPQPPQPLSPAQREARDLAAWGLSGPIETEATQTQHAEELKSVSDGHISVLPECALFDIDPANSLTRIGIGSMKNATTSRDTRAAAMRQVSGPLRLELCNMMDVAPVAGVLPLLAQPGHKCVPRMVSQYALLMRHCFGDNVPLEVQVAALLAIQRGLLADDALLQGGSASPLVARLSRDFPAELRQAVRRRERPLDDAQLADLVAFVKRVIASLAST
jgi:F0F1-type ATP synthase alpha subunit